MVAPPRTPPFTTSPELELSNLRALKVLGKGATGTVLLVHDSSSDPTGASPFALKLVDKSSASHDACRRARWEISVLSSLSLSSNPHPFLPHLIASFESDDLIAWAIPFCSGGDLNVLRHRQVDRVFSPTSIRFYIAEILLALRHLHSLGIAYRDLKPENVLIQNSGHVTLTDFDLSKRLRLKSTGPTTAAMPVTDDLLLNKPRKKKKNLSRLVGVVASSDVANKAGLRKAKSARVSPVSRRKPSDHSDGERSYSFVGTEEYVAPEVVRGDGHEFAVDWWALGVLTYEMLYGKTPFRGKNRKETFRNVLGKQPEFAGRRTDLTDLIERLLAKDPARRLGYQRGASEIMEHKFFRGVRWELLTQVVRPPFIPSRDDDDDGDQAENRNVPRQALDVREYFRRSRQPPPPSFPPSPPHSSGNYRRSLSLAEF